MMFSSTTTTYSTILFPMNWAKLCQLFSRRAAMPVMTAPVAIDLEVASSLDAFTSLEEIAPGMNWENLLAATWGLPAVTES